MRRPPGLVCWLDDPTPPALTLGLALQHLALQSVYFVLPAAVAGAISGDPGEITRFLCLSILACAAWPALQLLTRGPVGSGYPVPATHTAAPLGAYIVLGAAGGGFAAAGAMVLVTGLAAIALTFVMHRLRVVLPNEVAGVVVFLIGVALVTLGVQLFGLHPGGTPPAAEEVAVMLASILAMAVLALSRSRASPFAVLGGAAIGVVLALALGQAPPEAAAVLAAQPWIALPTPWLPAFDEIRVAPMLGFLLALIAMKATAAGGLVVVQRAADAGWTKPDAPPLRRGLLANGIAITLAGAIGGAAPGPNTAALGLSVATGTLARRVVWAGVPMLTLLALCPKLVALFVLTPAAVKAAMLFYVAGFLMAQGCQLASLRLLDTRRAMVVAFGLTAGIVAAAAPTVLLASLPALASPLAFGAVVAFVANLVTLPLVTRSASWRQPLEVPASHAISERFGQLAGSWGLKPETGRQAERALVELAELLAARGVAWVTLSARRLEDRVEIGLAWEGQALPARTGMPQAEDLLGPIEGQERVAVWIATRGAQSFTQREAAQGREARLVFED